MLAVLFWIGVFIVSLAALVKGADWLLGGAEKIGLSFGLSPFVIGVIFVGLGTSFPELMSSLAAIVRGAGEIVVANAAGSNIANILLIVGISAVIGKRLAVEKNLIDLELPMLAISTVLFLGVAYDGVVTRIEALILLTAFTIYLAYTTLYHEPSEMPVKQTKTAGKKDYALLIVGIAGLVIGAAYLIDSVIALSELLAIAPAAIAIIAVAFGTSLPELLVSIKAALRKKPEIALGNIFGSNAFNLLIVVGLPGIFQELPIDGQTLAVGIPALMLATFLFVISGISKRIHGWEGALFLLGYVLFTGKIFNLF